MYPKVPLSVFFVLHSPLCGPAQAQSGHDHSGQSRCLCLCIWISSPHIYSKSSPPPYAGAVMASSFFHLFHSIAFVHSSVSFLKAVTTAPEEAVTVENVNAAP